MALMMTPSPSYGQTGRQGQFKMYQHRKSRVASTSPDKLVSILKSPTGNDVKVTSISINDIYGLAERERLKSRESYTRDRRYRDNITSRSLPNSYGGTNRPHTEPVGSIVPFVRNSETTANSETHIMSVPSRSRMCIRAESTINPSTSTAINALSRQCCDVLGPHICHKCSKINERYKDTVKCDEAFPSLRVSAENFQTSVLLNKHLPDMTTYQIQNKVARGEICRVNFREKSSTLLESKRRQNNEYVHPEILQTKRRPKTLTSDGSTWTYFRSIRDLNSRMIDGKVPKKLPKTKLAMPDDIMPKDSGEKEEKSFSELLMPMFVGKRQHKPMLTSFIQYFDPPLLTVAAQNAEPAFFAGSKEAYKLPERLPDELFTEEELTIPELGGLGDDDDEVDHDSNSHDSKSPTSQRPYASEQLSATPIDNVSTSADEHLYATPDLKPFNQKYHQSADK
ncbi:unnamed protein product [Owenia fusiformis]|uniref:Uncharacterized protein n=1 Tax=Owenia fusiformis TaxID=6347 RepID=A0A8J1TDT2_OWEFU|nr:unnamed protein product [Owenia fusiformis]